MFLKFVELMKEDVASAREIDPAARSSLEVVLTYSGVHAIWFHRIAHFLYLANFFLVARIFSQLSRLLTGVEIHPAAQIGRSVFIDHGMGVVIGETAIIGQRCHLYQGVTLGGTSTRHEKRHPTLGDDVTVGAGAKIIGAVKIGSNVRIGAGSVVITSVPDGATVVGVPGHITSVVGLTNETVERLPDPEWERLEAVEGRINIIEEFIAKSEEE
ncbi:MAG: serine O-acetyltransferase [Chloroflexota bacterium]|nr:serine O-acetyltransferase [Chloroflexota bacterium]